MRARDVIFDVGSCFGLASLIAAKRLAGDCRIFAFETNPHNIPVLIENVALNGWQRSIFPMNIGIADRTFLSHGGFSKLLIDYAGTGLLIAGESRGTGNRPIAIPVFVPIMSIDTLVDEFRLPPPDHIKIDVDGAEALVLRGAAQALTRVRSVCLEWVDSDPRTREIVDAMRRDGFIEVYDRVNAERDLPVGVAEYGRHRDTIFVRA